MLAIRSSAQVSRMSITRLPPPELPRFIERQLPPMSRYRVSVGQYSMHVMELGRGRPVLMVHGNPTWGFLYRKVVQALMGEPLRLIVPDLIGLGFSDKPQDAAEHTLENHAHWLSRLIDGLALKNAIFVGQDWGGPIGGLAFSMVPNAMTGAVILNTVLGPPKAGAKPTAFHRFARLPGVSTAVFRGLGFPQRGMHLAQGDKRSVRGAVAKAYRHPLRGWRASVAPLALARMVPPDLNHPSVPQLEQLHAWISDWRGPCEVVWGTRDPILGRLKNRIARTLPEPRVTATEAGHFLQEEVPEDIAAAIRRVAAQG
jgi:haloalkane dehalogenase